MNIHFLSLKNWVAIAICFGSFSVKWLTLSPHCKVLAVYRIKSCMPVWWEITQTGYCASTKTISICAMKLYPISFEAFGSIWAHEFILLLLSFTSLINRNLVLPCSTDEFPPYCGWTLSQGWTLSFSKLGTESYVPTIGWSHSLFSLGKSMPEYWNGESFHYLNFRSRRNNAVLVYMCFVYFKGFNWGVLWENGVIGPL